MLESLTTKFLDKIAKTKKTASLLGKLFIGLPLAFCFIAPETGSTLVLVVEVVVASTCLFLGLCLLIRSQNTESRS